MSVVLWSVLGLVALLIVLELVARIIYRFRFLVPFHSRRIAEYPYRKFIEEVDPPLHYHFKKNFRSPLVNINRFYCRGPQPAPDGQKKRMIILNESNIFGVKLLKEEHVWSIQLQKILDEHYPGRWEVLNGGNPGYTTDQHRLFWLEQLRHINPDIVLIGMGANDTAIASIKGKDWQPDAVWPMEFIYAQERKTSLWQHWANGYCLYFLWRRWRSGPPQSRFAVDEETFQEQACLDNIRKNVQVLVEEATRLGAKAAGIGYAPVVDFELTPEEQRKADSIQANWRLLLETRTRYDLRFLDFVRRQLYPGLGLPYIDTYAHFRRHPRRFEMYFDLLHWNDRGMKLAAQIMYQEIDKLGWWSQ